MYSSLILLLMFISSSLSAENVSTGICVSGTVFKDSIRRFHNTSKDIAIGNDACTFTIKFYLQNVETCDFTRISLSAGAQYDPNMSTFQRWFYSSKVLKEIRKDLRDSNQDNCKFSTSFGWQYLVCQCFADNCNGKPEFLRPIFDQFYPELVNNTINRKTLECIDKRFAKEGLIPLKNDVTDSQMKNNPPQIRTFSFLLITFGIVILFTIVLLLFKIYRKYSEGEQERWNILDPDEEIDEEFRQRL